VSTFGERTAAGAIHKRLNDVFGAGRTDIDLRVLSEHIAEDLDSTAIKMIDARETALQEALQATMTYLGGVIDSQRGRISQLEQQVFDMTKALARRPIIPLDHSEGG
jgi:hypothetical protein